MFLPTSCCDYLLKACKNVDASVQTVDIDVRNLQLNSKWVVQNQHLADTIIFPNLFGLRGDLELIRRP